MAVLGLIACGGDSTPREPTGPDLPGPPAAVTLSADTLRFAALGMTAQLTATVADAEAVTIQDAEVAWSTLDDAVATVSATGLVAAVGVGETDVIAAAGDVSGSATVLVTQEPASVTGDADRNELVALGDSARLSATVRDANGHAIAGAAVAWSSTNEAVATVRGDGWVVAAANGEAEVVAAAGDLADTVAIVVAQQPATVEVSPAAVELREGESEALSAAAWDALGHPLEGTALEALTLEWSSADQAVATVDASGMVTAVGWGGGATITASAGAASGQAAVSVLGQIAFVVAYEEIHRIHADGSGAINLTPVQGNEGPVWSPDGTRIAFLSSRDGNTEIYVMDADGSDPVNLTTDDAFDDTPAWSPDGTRIAFASDRDGDAEIYVVNADGSELVRLTDNDAFDAYPIWSPDGTRIAFESERDGDGDIFVMDADGSGQTNLTPFAGSDEAALWSPDGTRLAFQGSRDGIDDVFVVPADGSGDPVNLTDHPLDDFGPVWSPDGTRIAFISERDGYRAIYLMDPDGANVVGLTSNAAGDQNPDWSPDGTRIAFVSYRDGQEEIYVMNADGSEQTRLTQDGNRTHPRWRPWPDG